MCDMREARVGPSIDIGEPRVGPSIDMGEARVGPSIEVLEVRVGPSMDITEAGVGPSWGLIDCVRQCICGWCQQDSPCLHLDVAMLSHLCCLSSLLHASINADTFSEPVCGMLCLIWCAYGLAVLAGCHMHLCTTAFLS